jgi:two-component system, chemotaxis family, CheB/CheR fusion protein
MRPHKYPSSEQVRLPNSFPSAQIIALDVATGQLSKMAQAGAVGTGASAKRRSTGKLTIEIKEALPVNSQGCRSNVDDRATSKDKRHSGNQERAGLDSQLQPSLERQRLKARDLQKVWYSTDVATILLDADLNIRFFTPATKLLYNVIPGDIGRPLTDLSSLAPDGALVSDARKVLLAREPIEREIEARSGAWYARRILPYRSGSKGIEGIVITFADITRQKEAAAALECARVQAESANVAKSRFLAAASHDLRQPLQTLVLLQELLAKLDVGDKAKKLIGRLDQTLGGMSEMLNALLDINQIEAGTVRAEFETFRIDAVLDRVTADLAYQAEAQRIALHVLPCSLSVRSDPRLLEQMIRNLLSNAIKYTKRGRVLLGCRRRSGNLSIQIWDTGAGIPEGQLQDIFEEYHQLDNSARDRSLGLGLGLSIVRRLGILLDHPVMVRSQQAKGSVFSIEVKQSQGGMLARNEDRVPGIPGEHSNAGRARTILVVEDDQEVRDLLAVGLRAEGHRVITAVDGVAALDYLETKALQPGLVISDFNLPNGMDGLSVAARIRSRLGRSVPVIILTGDISTRTLRDIALQECEHLNKPASLKELVAAIERLVPASALRASPPASPVEAPAGMAPVIFVVDDDSDARQAIRSMLEHDGRLVEDYEDGESFLNAYRPGRNACLLIDANLPGISGLDLLRRLKEAGHLVPAIMITGQSDVPMAVEAMKAGASDFLEKPIRGAELLAGVGRALELLRDSGKLEWRKEATDHLAGLTRRQHQIMEMVLAGHPSKNIAADLGISQRTVENHRASIMKKTGTKSIPALARLAVTAAGDACDRPASQNQI